MATLNFSRYAPKEHLLPSVWSEKNVLVPAGNARPGRISFLEAPFQRGILDTCVDPKINRVTVMSGAQVGKTMIALCLMGFHTSHEPMSQVFMQPTETDLKKWLRGKFDPMVAANPKLRNTYATPRGRDGVNNTIMKEFSGGMLYLAWAGSTNTMRGISTPLVICDEAEAYEYTEEGHPVNILRQRGETFGDKRKLIELSTPKIKNKSWIEKAYLNGDQRKYWVICPHCSEKHLLKWENVRFDPDDVSSALIHCPGCDYGFNDTERISLVRYAEKDGAGWEASKPTLGHASFHISVFYSPLRRLQDVVQNYIDAQAEPDRDMPTFWNTCLGETYENINDSADGDELEARACEYPVEIPEGVKILTAGVDVQKDRLEVEVVGWGTGEESWNIAYEVFYGDTSNYKDVCFRELMNFASRGFQMDDGGQRMFIESMGIDSGYNTIAIYNFVRAQSKKIPRVYALKGVGGWNRDVLKSSKPQVTYKGVRPALFTVAVDIAKRILMQRLNVKEPGAGYCHFPTERTSGDYFKQLTGEVLLHDPRTNKWKWTKKDTDTNEALDCRVYAWTALQIANPDLSQNIQYGVRGKGGQQRPKQAVKTIRNRWA